MDLSEKIEEFLLECFLPTHLEVVNESALHSGHAGDDGSGESHFKVVIVSEKFAGRSRIERHRMIYEAIKNQVKSMPHALSIKAFCPSEFSQ